MKGFTFPGHAQQFLSAFSGISPHFRPRRRRLRADAYRREMTSRFATCNEVIGLIRARLNGDQDRFPVSTMSHAILQLERASKSTTSSSGFW